MINIETLLKIKEKNELTIEATIWLWLIEEGSYYLMESFDQGWTVTLLTCGYINSNNEITEKGRNYLKSIIGGKINKIDYGVLYEKLYHKMIQITGHSQKTIQKKYSFFPNKQDFSTKLSKVVTKYKLTDIDKVEKCLIKHIKNCKEANWEYIQLMIYFISKDNKSSLVDMYNNFSEEEKEEVKENLEPTQIKDLF